MDMDFFSNTNSSTSMLGSAMPNNVGNPIKPLRPSTKDKPIRPLKPSQTGAINTSMNLGSLNATGMGMQMNMNVNNSGQQPMQTNVDIVELQPTRSAPSSAGTGMLANNTMPKRPQRPSSTNIPNAMQKIQGNRS